MLGKEIESWVSDLHAEHVVIGLALTDAGSARTIAQVPRDFFFTKKGRDVHQFVQREIAAGRSPSLIRAAELGVIDDDEVPQLEDFVVYSDHLEGYLLSLRDKAILRTVLNFGDILIQKGKDVDAAVSEMVYRIQSFSVGGSATAVSADMLASEIPELYSPPSIVTGIDFVDQNLSIRDGNLVVVAGRPAVGKSWFGIQLVRLAGLAGKKALFVSLEMSQVEVAKRLAIQAGADTEDEVVNWLSEHGSNLFVSTSAYTPDAVRREVSRIGGADLVVVDYLQLMAPDSRKGGTRNEEVAMVSRGLKKLALEARIPVVALCQLNRLAAGDDARPALHHIRDSGAIEADADIVCMIYDDDETTYFDIKKNRHGKSFRSRISLDLYGRVTS